MLCFLYARIPSYKDVVGEDTAEGGGANTDGIESGEGEGEGEGLLVSSDEEEVERQEQFEREYNFRFEEPGGTDVSKHDTRQPPSPCTCTCTCSYRRSLVPGRQLQ